MMKSLTPNNFQIWLTEMTRINKWNHNAKILIRPQISPAMTFLSRCVLATSANISLRLDNNFKLSELLINRFSNNLTYEKQIATMILTILFILKIGEKVLCFSNFLRFSYSYLMESFRMMTSEFLISVITLNNPKS